MSDRKELIKAYKMAQRPMGVFQIRNTTNGRVFVAKGINLEGIMTRHRCQLQMKAHQCRELQEDYNALGPDAFAFEVIETLEHVSDPEHNYAEDLQVLEELCIERLQPYGDRGYHKQKNG
jgi:predicted ferric reductase